MDRPTNPTVSVVFAALSVSGQPLTETGGWRRRWRPAPDRQPAMAAIDYDHDAIFDTPEGARLAQDTSHSLTPDMINHMTERCDIIPR